MQRNCKTQRVPFTISFRNVTRDIFETRATRRDLFPLQRDEISTPREGVRKIDIFRTPFPLTVSRRDQIYRLTNYFG